MYLRVDKGIYSVYTNIYPLYVLSAQNKLAYEKILRSNETSLKKTKNIEGKEQEHEHEYGNERAIGRKSECIYDTDRCKKVGKQ